MSFVISLSGFLYPFPGGEREGGFRFLSYILLSICCWPLRASNPWIIVHFVANHGPHFSHFLAHVIFHAPNGNNFLNMNCSIIRVFLPQQISKVCNPILVYSVIEMHCIQWHIPINILLRIASVKSDSILNLARVLILTRVQFLNHHTLAVS